jgi:hypothetical protein
MMPNAVYVYGEPIDHRWGDLIPHPTAVPSLRTYQHANSRCVLNSFTEAWKSEAGQHGHGGSRLRTPNRRS